MNMDEIRERTQSSIIQIAYKLRIHYIDSIGIQLLNWPHLGCYFNSFIIKLIHSNRTLHFHQLDNEQILNNDRKLKYEVID